MGVRRFAVVALLGPLGLACRGPQEPGSTDEVGETETETGPAPSCGPELSVAAERWFAAPPITWADVDGASGYELRIATSEAGLDEAPLVSETATSPWTGALEVGGYFVRVTAQPSGEACEASFRVRGLDSTPDVISPEPLCGNADGVGSKIAYAAAVLDGSVYASFNADGAGICRYDAETLAYVETIPGFGGNFRTFGVAADPSGDLLYFSTYPFVGNCGDRLDRTVVVADPDGAKAVATIDTGVEAANSIALGPGALLHSSGPALGNCWQEDSFCLDLGAACSNGDAGWASYDLGNSVGLSHGGAPVVSAGIAADEDAVYRAGIGDTLEVFDPLTGPLASVPLPASPRGLIRVDVGGDRLLIATLFDNTLRVYRLPASGPALAEADLEQVHMLSLDDRYWQGAYDPETDALYFPAQDSRTIRRHDLR